MSEQAAKTPLIDLLRSVPVTHRTEWETQWADDGTPTGYAICPVGKHCHDAADRIEKLDGEINRLKEEQSQNINNLLDTIDELQAKLDAFTKDFANCRETAADDIEDWGAYASKYFQRKHRLNSDVQRYYKSKEDD